METAASDCPVAQSFTAVARPRGRYCRSGERVLGRLRGQDGRMTLSLPIDPEATKLLYSSPLALILAMLLDQ